MCFIIVTIIMIIIYLKHIEKQVEQKILER